MSNGIRQLTMAEYLAAPGVSKHGLDWFNLSPEHYRDYRSGVLVEEQTEAMRFGTLLHALVFENRRDFAVKPATYPSGDTIKPWHGGASFCKEWEAEQTLPVISQSESALLECSNAAIQAHPLSAKLLADGQAEVSMFADDPRSGLSLKCRSDWQFPKSIVDLKTTTDARTHKFSKEIYQRRYHVQAAINLYVAELLGMDVTDFYFIILEKGQSPRLNVRLLKQDAVGLGRIELHRDLEALAECMESDEWPGYCGGEIENIGLPPYAGAEQTVELQIGGKTVTV